MKISKKSPIDRIFSWWHLAKYGYSPGNYTNLCPYVRAVLFWALPRWVWLSGPERVRVASWTTTICIAELIGWAPMIVWWNIGEIPAHWTWQYAFAVFTAIWILAHFVAGFVVGGGLILCGISELVRYFNIKDSRPVNILGNLGDDISNLTIGTYTAIHDKVCPPIKRTD